MESRLRCRECGTRYEEWNPKEGGDLHAYYPEVYECLGCKALHEARDAAIENAKKNKNDHPYLPWLRVRLIPQLEKKARQYRARYFGSKKEDENGDKKPSRPRGRKRDSTGDIEFDI